MNPKEDFSKQVEAAKQQLKNEKTQEELQTRQKTLAAEAAKKEEDANNQRLEQQKIEETRRNFAGTNIVETLEYIQKNQILVLDKKYKNTDVRDKDFLGFIFGTTHTERRPDVNIPIQISYAINSITAVFDYISGNSNDDEPSTYKQIYVIKNGQQIHLSYSDVYHFPDTRPNHSFTINSENPNDIIVGIAKVVALNQVK